MSQELVRKTLRGSDFFRINWREEFKITPDQFFTITVHKVEAQMGVDTEVQSYDVPKQYSDSVKEILKKAKTDLKEKEKYGYSREDAVQDFFEVQEKFSQHIKEQSKCQ